MPACAYCGGEFTGKRSVAKFCSDRCCRDNFQRNPANRVPCAVCGGSTGYTPGQGGVHPGLRCRECQRTDDRRRVEERWERIEGLWAEGLLAREIAHRLGWTLNRFCAERGRMRRAGRNLPYRYPAGRRRASQEAQRCAREAANAV